MWLAYSIDEGWYSMTAVFEYGLSSSWTFLVLLVLHEIDVSSSAAAGPIDSIEQLGC